MLIDSLFAVAGQVLFSTDELKKQKGILTKAEWAARYQAPLEGSPPFGVPEYEPLLEAGQYNGKPFEFISCTSANFEWMLALMRTCIRLFQLQQLGRTSRQASVTSVTHCYGSLSCILMPLIIWCVCDMRETCPPVRITGQPNKDV